MLGFASRARRLFTPFYPLPVRWRPEGPGPRSRIPLPAGCASLDLGVTRRLLQPETTRGHTRRAFDPRARVGHSPRYSPVPIRGPAASTARCVATSRASESRPAHLGCSPRCPTCVDGAGRESRRLGESYARGVTMSRARSPLRLGHPCHRRRLVTHPGRWRDSSDRPRSISDAAPRRATPLGGSRCLLPLRSLYAIEGLLLRARLDRCPVTPPR